MKRRILLLIVAGTFLAGQPATGLAEQPLFPRSAEPRFLSVVDVRGMGNPLENLAASVQGNVNRSEPRLYVLYRDNDLLWLNYLRDRYGIEHETLGNPGEMLDRFRTDFNGGIVYDPAFPDSINIATMRAGLEDALIVHPDLTGLLEDTGVPIMDDLRGRWDDRHSMYAWALETFWPLCHKGVIADLNIDDTRLRDYLVQHRIFTFTLRPENQPFLEEMGVLARFLCSTPCNIPVLGYLASHGFDEVIGTAFLSLFNKYLVPSDHASNLTVHSGIPVGTYHQEHLEPGRPQNRIYLSFVMSDGDNVCYNMGSMVTRWNDPARGSVPIGWTLSPFLVDLAPAVLDYFYSSRSGLDYFVAPPSGTGYIFPILYPALEDYLRLSAPYTAALDLNTVWLLNYPPSYPDWLTTGYEEILGMEGFFADYTPIPLGPSVAFSKSGAPILRAAYITDKEAALELLRLVRVLKFLVSPRDPVYLFVGVNAWDVRPGDLAAMVQELGPQFVALRPDEIVRMLRKEGQTG